MNTKIESDQSSREEPEQAPGEEGSSETPTDEASAKEPEQPKKPPQANWEYRTEFRINTQMREILNLTRQATETEIARLRRKIEKLTYGS